MADCQIVLRYFALSDLTKFRGSMKHTLDNCMLLMQNIPPNIRDSLSKEFLNSLDIAIRVYGDQLFRLPNRAGELRRQRSVPLLDAVLLGIRNLGQNASLLPNHSEAILKGTKDLLMKKEIELMTNMYRSVLEG
jgi:hypothetical protein